MRAKAWVVLMVACLMMGPQEASARDPGYKFGRGLVNVLLGWMSYPSHFRACRERSGPEFLYLPCAAQAVVPTLLHEALGVVEMATFPIPWPLKDYGSPYEGWAPGDYPWKREP